MTGELGGSAAALAQLMESRCRWERKFRNHFRPQPRVAVGQWLRRHGLASAMIDLSDGLSTDLEHICEESRVGAEIEAEAIPRARRGTEEARSVALELALHGGDDYELLFTSAAKVPCEGGGSSSDADRARSRRSNGMRLIGADGKTADARG